MTCPCWSIARYRWVQRPATLTYVFVDEPPIARRAACGARGVDELRSEGLHPPVRRHVIDLDAALGQQLLNVPVGQSVAQVPAHRDRDHLTWEPVAGRSGRGRPRIDHCVSVPATPQEQPTQQGPGQVDGADSAEGGSV
jgi:hypothetical protein